MAKSVTSKTVARVLLVERFPMLRNGLQLLLGKHNTLEIVAAASESAEAVKLAAAEKPDLVVVCILIPTDDELKAIADLRRSAPDIKILVVLRPCSAELQHQIVQMGAVGIVCLDESTETLARAIEKVRAGEVWLDRRMVARVLYNVTKPSNDNGFSSDVQKIKMLTPRERTVVTLVGEGLKNKQIAKKMLISEATVRHHLTSIFNKLEVEDRLSLVLYAQRQGLITAPAANGNGTR